MRTRTLVLALLFASTSPALAGGLIDKFGAPSWEVGGTQKDGLLGFSATTAGDVDGDGYNDVIVGALLEDSTFTDEGTAYLYRGSSHGTLLTPSWAYHGRQASAAAGSAVCSAGDVNRDGYADVLVAIPGWDEPGHDNVGKVAVFHGGPAGLSANPDYFLFSPNASDNSFGISVAPAGDINGDGYADVIVGSQLPSGGFTIGAAYVFDGGVGGLFTTPSNTMLGFPGADSRMGYRVSGAGDVNGDGFADVIIGSPGDSRAFASAGAAYIMTGKAAGPMELDTLIVGTAANQILGQGVSVAGDVNGDGYSDVLIGVPGFNTFAGKAKIGFGGNNGIATVVDLGNPEAPPNEFIGAQLSTVGDINGDGFADIGVVARYTTGTSHGRISIYLGSRTGPVYFGEILTHGISGFFGNSIATSGDTDGDGFSEILVGTEDASVQPGQNEGVVYQFKPPRNGLVLSGGGWPKLGASPGSGYGSAVALIDIFDGIDGGKLVIGDPQFGGNGRVSMHYVEFNSGVAFNEQMSLPATGSFQSFGAKVADVGDVDANGFSDFVMSKPTVNNGPASQAGVVILQKGGLGGVSAPVTIFGSLGLSSFDRVGSALAGRGDINGDGYQDVLIGAREWDEPGKPDCGKVFLFFGSASGDMSIAWTRVGTVAEQGFGAGVALTDLDGDGYSDVIVGSSSPTFGSTASGKVEVFYGKPGNPAEPPGLTYLPPAPEVSFGLTVAAIGDMNGDGVADLGIGAPRENGAGVVRIYPGSLGRSQQQRPLLKYDGTQANARWGEAIAGGGDIDGDGLGDYVIGEPGWDGGQTDEGRFALYYGSRLEFVAPTYVESNIVGAALGASVSPFRDVNWDGFADVAVGAPGAAGRVYMFMGSSVGMRNYLEPVDYMTFSVRNFHPGRSHDPDQLAATFFYHVAGQGRSKTGFEIEVKPSSAPFDGIPTSLSGPDTFDSGTPGSVVPTFPIAYLGGELPGRTLKMRGRWTTKNPLFPRSRWVTPDAHTSGDHDEWILGTSVDVPSASTGTLKIESVAPNPSSRSSVVSFSLPTVGHVSLDVYDLRGARVRRLLSEARPAGPSSVAWDGKSDDGRVAAAGVYLVVLRSGDAVQRAKLVRFP